MQELREDPRQPKQGKFTVTWRDRDGKTFSVDGRGVDISKSGIGIETFREIPVDSVVQIKSSDGTLARECFVAHCTRRGIRLHVGMEFSDRSEKTKPKDPPKKAPENLKTDDTDYYEILQISHRADTETIHRVFRIMAARFHPDNPETGDQEQFLRLKRAYDVLSDAERRAQYDAIRDEGSKDPLPIFESKDFVTGIEAEHNRRLGVLSLLYNQRRTDPDKPGISLLDLESLMGFPREYLSFTLWYLRSKEYVAAADNSDYALSAAGVDYVESNVCDNEILARLLRPSGTRPGRGKGSSASEPIRLAPRGLPEPTIAAR